MQTETQFIDPAKASSALGETIARLLQASGLEIDFGSFLAIDGIAKTFQSLQRQLIRLDMTEEIVAMKDRIDQIEDAPGQSDINDLKARLSSLTERVEGLAGDFSNLYDSIPIADRPALDSQTFSSGNDNDDDDGDESPFVSAA